MSINATTNDMEKAETAVLRRANDQYRQIIFDSQVYANTDAATYEKAVDMATKDFLAAGLTCIEYANGARHTISDYTDMALKTAAKRAYLQGEGEKRREWGISTVIINKRGDNPCPLCVPFVGKVMIDDVWSGGSSKDGPYPLLSTAISYGLYHPRCRDSHTTYFPGISSGDSTWAREELEKIKADYATEQKEQYAKRQAEKYERLANGSLDSGNKRNYENRAEKWKTEAANLAESDESEVIDGIRRKTKEITSGEKVVSYSGLSQNIRMSFEDGLTNADPVVKKALRKHRSGVDYIETKTRSKYKPGNPGTIRINRNDPPGTLAHELFHSIDKKHNVSSSLKASLLRDYNDLLAKSGSDVKLYLMQQYPDAFEIRNASGEAVFKTQYRGISDILNGLSGGSVFYGSGHKKVYWKKKGNLESEAWAQFGRIYYDNEREVRELFSKLFSSFEKDAIIALKGVL